MGLTLQILKYSIFQNNFIMRIESFQAALEKIIFYFQEKTETSFTTNDLVDIFNTKRDEWKIAKYRTVKHFLFFIIENKILTKITLKHQVTGSIKTILTKDVNYSLIALTIKKNGYLSNYTAMSLHNLTLQIPKNIYLSYLKEKPFGYSKTKGKLQQKAIDLAFSKPQRVSSEVYKSEQDNFKITILQKAYHEENIGVISNNNLKYTDLERTLLDIVIRPVYAGGVFEVLEAFEKAKTKLNITKLHEYLKKMNLTYPYSQLVGFYLEKAKYDLTEIEVFRKNINFNFYLTYNISNKVFDNKWNVFYPKGF